MRYTRRESAKRLKTNTRLTFVKTILALAIALSIASLTSAQSSPFAKGPDPSNRLLEARSGPFSTSTDSVSLFALGFGGGTIYYPDEAGSYGLIAMCPGYTATGSTIAWLGSRLASHGFVVIVIDTITVLDFPASRATQLEAAINYALNSSSSAVRSRIDPNRRAVAGHSMGGGGTLLAAQADSSLKAAFPMTPWNLSSLFQGVRVPTFIVGAQADTIAPVATHSIPFYNALPRSLDKAYGELRLASHFAPNLTDDTIGKYAVAWMKRFVDEDTRYSPFLCGEQNLLDRAGLTFSDYRETCPY